VCLWCRKWGLGGVWFGVVARDRRGGVRGQVCMGTKVRMRGACTFAVCRSEILN